MNAKYFAIAALLLALGCEQNPGLATGALARVEALAEVVTGGPVREAHHIGLILDPSLAELGPEEGSQLALGLLRQLGPGDSLAVLLLSRDQMRGPTFAGHFQVQSPPGNLQGRAAQEWRELELSKAGENVREQLRKLWTEAPPLRSPIAETITVMAARLKGPRRSMYVVTDCLEVESPLINLEQRLPSQSVFKAYLSRKGYLGGHSLNGTVITFLCPTITTTTDGKTRRRVDPLQLERAQALFKAALIEAGSSTVTFSHLSQQLTQ